MKVFSISNIVNSLEAEVTDSHLFLFIKEKGIKNANDVIDTDFGLTVYMHSPSW